MSLREALATRLHGIFWHGTPAWEACEPHEAERWRDLADEVVRQMEWARRYYDGNPAIMISAGVELSPLTLAPPEWTP